MADESNQFAVIFDPDKGFQLLNVDTNQVADMAVLEGTWRARGEPSPEGHDVQGHTLNLQGQIFAGSYSPGTQSVAQNRFTTLQYGSLRIRSTGLSPYAIADPRVSLRDDRTEDA